jgi:hypothetical protein
MYMRDSSGDFADLPGAAARVELPFCLLELLSSASISLCNKTGYIQDSYWDLGVDVLATVTI